LEYISLFQHSIKQPLEAENVVSIFIGQPIYEDIKSKESNNVSIIQDLIKFYNIEYYFPHPRETYFIKDVLYINTELIFEDYFLNEVSRNPNVHYRLYNFLSGAALNLIGIPNVTVISIKPNDLSCFWNDAYELMKSDRLQIVNWDALKGKPC
ncbi:glycosyltransferase family 52, partial [Actinobacillus suis]